MKKYFFILVILAFMLSHGKGFSQDIIPQPCTPADDPCQLPWSNLTSLTYPISQDCQVIVYFVTRVCPPLKYEMQMLHFDLYGNCSQIPLFLIIQDPLKKVANYCNEQYQWLPQDPDPNSPNNCYDYYFFYLASCFVKLVYGQLGPPHCPLMEPHITYIPCDNTGCCQQQYRACKLSYGVSLKPIGDLTGQGECSHATWPDLTNFDPPCPPCCPESEGDCIASCDALLLKSGRIGDYNIDNNDDGISINTISTTQKQTIIFNIESKSNNSLIIRINDLKGNELKVYNLNVIKGFNSQEIDISNYTSGYYLVNIYKNNQLLKTIKTIIIK